MTPNPKDDSGQIKRKGHGKRVISLLNELNNCHIKIDKVRQQTAQEIFKELELIKVMGSIVGRIGIDVIVTDCKAYNEIKQKYLGDEK